MKNIKSIIALVVVLFALGGIATWDEWKTKKEESETKAKNQLTSLRPADVNEIFYTSRSEEPPVNSGVDQLDIHLVKTDGVWKIVEPIQVLADNGAVENLIKSITDFNFASVVAKDRSSWKKFGIETPEQKVAFKTINGSEETFFFGSKAPVGYNSYLATSKSDDVLMGSQHIAMAVNKSLYDLRDKSLAKIDEGKIKTFSYYYAEIVVDLVKEGGKYSYVDNSAEPDGAYVRDFIDDLNFVRIDKFIDQPEADLVERLKNPEVRVAFTFDGLPDLKMGFLSNKDKMYGSIEGRSIVFELPADFSRKILKKKNDFRNRRIVNSDFMSTIVSITIDGTFYKKVEGNWYTGDEIKKAENPTKGDDVAVEAAQIRPFVVDLEFAKTEDFYPNAHPDYSKSLAQAPLHRIIIEGKENGKKITIELFKHELLEDKYWVRVSGASSGYLVAKSNFDSINPPAAADGTAPLSPEG